MSQTIVGNLAVELGVSDAQLQAGLAQAVTQAQAAGQKMAQAMNRGQQQAGGGLAGSAQGLLNVSRAIDDVQYGFRGIINNIEGIVTGLGYGAGVAGAATIAAVALNAIVPRVAEIVMATGPMERLSESIKSIQNSGLQGTFLGIAAEAKATQEAFEASAKVLEGMRKQQMVATFFAGGPGMAAPVAANEKGGIDPRDIFAQQVRVNELAQNAARESFDAVRQRQRVAMAGLAGNDSTTAGQDTIKLNQELFQAAVDKFGGGQQLADALKMKALGNPAMFGAFKEGDIKTSEEAVRLLGLQAEKAKIMADDFERRTGAAAELNRIENDRLNRQQKIDDRQFNEYQNAVTQQDKLFDRRDSIMLQRSRSEILGSAAEVFNRNINAGQEDPQLKELREINQGIKELSGLTGLG